MIGKEKLVPSSTDFLISFLVFMPYSKTEGFYRTLNDYCSSSFSLFYKLILVTFFEMTLYHSLQIFKKFNRIT